MTFPGSAAASDLHHPEVSAPDATVAGKSVKIVYKWLGYNVISMGISGT